MNLPGCFHKSVQTGFALLILFVSAYGHAAPPDRERMSSIPLGTKLVVTSTMEFKGSEGVLYSIDTIKPWRKNSSPESGDSFCSVVLRNRRINEPVTIDRDRVFVVNERPEVVITGDGYRGTRIGLAELVDGQLEAGPLASLVCANGKIVKEHIAAFITVETESRSEPTIGQMRKYLSSIFQIAAP